MILREAVITFILLGLTIYLLLVDIFVVPVLTERCIEESGVTCTELRDREGAPDWPDQLDPTDEYDGDDALLDEPQGEGE